ncbi:hypothetical protein OIU77_022810 [Salix suchowensis]|uniref:Uncharacterized protein n=1 Tax=Salix suchowensis TaxID=1278906 RepID=A0ABQ9C4M5_9ROSI|nr:hypothetical protein OIU77_022810 [Salix suchowensis]
MGVECKAAQFFRLCFPLLLSSLVPSSFDISLVHRSKRHYRSI